MISKASFRKKSRMKMTLLTCNALLVASTWLAGASALAADSQPSSPSSNAKVKVKEPNVDKTKTSVKVTAETGLRFCIATRHARCFVIPSASGSSSVAASGNSSNTDKLTNFDIEQTLNDTLVTKRSVSGKERAELVKKLRSFDWWAKSSETKLIGKKGEIKIPCEFHLTLEEIDTTSSDQSPTRRMVGKVCRDRLPSAASGKIKTLIRDLSQKSQRVTN